MPQVFLNLFMYKEDAMNMVWHDAELHGFYLGVILLNGKPAFLYFFTQWR